MGGDRHALVDRTQLADAVRRSPCVALAVARVDLHLRLALPAVPQRLRHRVRPAHDHLRAPAAAVVLVLRPRAVRAADLARELRHPLGADVPHVRAGDRAQLPELRRRVRVHADRSTCRSRSSRWRRCPASTSSASAMRKRMFPLSWMVQARLAEVATIVDENISGVRVVKSFAAERRQLSAARSAAPNACGGRTSRDADIRGALGAADREPAAPRARARAPLRRLARRSTARSRSARSSRSTPT